MQTQPKGFFSQLWALLRRYYDHGVGLQGAAIAYYLLFSIFPLLIFLSTFLGMLDLDPEPVLASLHNVVPQGVLEIVEQYLEYVTVNANSTLMSFALVFTVYFPLRTSLALVRGIGRAYGGVQEERFWVLTLRVLLYTLLLTLSIAVTLVTMLTSGRVLSWIDRWFPLSPVLFRLWPVGRFVLLALVLLLALLFLYGLTLPGHRGHWRCVLPGAVAALAAWLLASAGYSAYVEHFGRYTVLYGSIGAVMVTLIWLWLSAVIILMGAELNGLQREKKERKNVV